MYIFHQIYALCLYPYIWGDLKDNCLGKWGISGQRQVTSVETPGRLCWFLVPAPAVSLFKTWKHCCPRTRKGVVHCEPLSLCLFLSRLKGFCFIQFETYGWKPKISVCISKKGEVHFTSNPAINLSPNQPFPNIINSKSMSNKDSRRK